MEGDESNNWGYPPASSPFPQENDEISSINRPNNVSENTGVFNIASNFGDQMFYPFIPSSTASLPSRQMHRTYQASTYTVPDVGSGSNLMVDLNHPPNFQDPMLDRTYVNVGANVPSLYRQHLNVFGSEEPDISSGHDRTGAVGNATNWNPELDRKFSMIRGNGGGSFATSVQFGNSDFGNTCGPQINSLHGSVGSKTVLYQPQETRGTSSLSQNQLEAPQSGSSRGVDRNFLSLGIDGKTDSISKSNPGNRVIIGHKDSAISPYLNMSHVQAAGGSSLYQAPELQNAFSSYQSVDGHLNMSNNAGGLNFAHNTVGAMNNTSYLLNSSSYHGIQRPQPHRQHSFPKPSNNNLGFMSYKDPRYANIDPCLRGSPAAPSGKLSSSSSGFLYPAEIAASSRPPTSAGMPWSASQPTSDHFEKMFTESMRIKMLENASSTGYRGIPTGQGPSGQVFPASRKSVAQAQTLNERAQLLMRKGPESYGCFQASNSHGIPSLKRSIIHPNTSFPRVQRRKTMLQYPINPYGSSLPTTTPTGSTPTRISGFIRASGGVPRPSGHKCMLCKRDLSFSPEGPIQQPSPPPSVAVLPCQHTFHDQCLERITPADQAKNPPCIPCAMGDEI